MSPILQLQDGKTTSEEDNSIDSARGGFLTSLFLPNANDHIFILAILLAMVELSTDSTTPGGEQGEITPQTWSYAYL